MNISKLLDYGNAMVRMESNYRFLNENKNYLLIKAGNRINCFISNDTKDSFVGTIDDLECYKLISFFTEKHNKLEILNRFYGNRL